MGLLRPTDRRLRGANGSPITILGCSSCMVSFLGLRTEFPVLVCDLSMDAIIGTDTLGSILPHTLDIKKGLLFTDGGVSLQLHRRDAALSGRVFTVGHCSIPPCSEAVLHCTTWTVGGRSFSSSGLLEGLTVFAENTGLVVGRTLVDPSGWRVPVLVSNFSQETVMVEPFSEVGMIAQVSAIQLVMDKPVHASYDPAMLPDHLQEMLNLTCIKRKSPNNRHHPLGTIPTGHQWDRISMDILDVCDPTPDGYRYIIVIADYFSKWTEAFPIKNKCADTVADVLVRKIILRFGMPLVIHSDQGREFENGLMKSLCNLLGCVKTRTAPYHPESDGMVEWFNRTCLMMLSMFVNDRRDNWNELLPFVMHAYRTSVHESTGYSPFRLMMGEECSLPQDVSTDELRTNREEDVAPHPFATWVRDALEVAYDHVRQSLKRTAARRKRLYDVKAVNRKFPVGSWVLRYYPPAAQKELGSPWVGPQQVVRMATGHTVGIQKDPEAPIIFIHVDDLKICPSPDRPAWTPEASKARSLCARISRE